MRRILITLIVLLFASSLAVAQYGKIAGTVVDEYGDGIIGAVVQIVELSRGSFVMNLDGDYTILGIEPGIYSVRATSIGYGPQTIKRVLVQEALTTPLSFVLTEAALQLEEVVIEFQPPAEGFHEITYSDFDLPRHSPTCFGGRLGNKIHYRGNRYAESLVNVDGQVFRIPRRPKATVERVNTIGVPARILIDYDFPTRIRYR